MRLLRNRVSSALSLKRVMGLAAFSQFVFYHLSTSPFFWEWMLVKKIRGKSLISAMNGLASWQSEALVSVVLPINNGRSKGVERLVESIKAQTHRNIELIAVDSGSTDDTPNWLRGEGFKVIEITPSSFTHAYSRNTGAMASRGDYLLFTVDDAVFNDPDWLRTALYLMHKFKADSMSSRQSVDEKADAYSIFLSSSLSLSQSDQPGINLSRTHFFGQWMRRILPLRAQMRSISIDDTNHLVRRQAYERIRFHAPTVEDLEFAINLTKVGGRTLYTNLLSILHYHVYNETTLNKYARRVFIDTKVIGRWQPYAISMRSREGFLLAALKVLVLFLLAFEKLDESVEQSVDTSLNMLVHHTEVLQRNHLGVIRYDQYAAHKEAVRIFEMIIGAVPPSNLYFQAEVISYFFDRLKEDILASKQGLIVGENVSHLRGNLKTITVFLWVNRVMSHMARPEIFRNVERSYPCDDWNVKDWA